MVNSDDLAIGIDIGGTNTAFGIVNRAGKVIQRGSIKPAIIKKLSLTLTNCF